MSESFNQSLFLLGCSHQVADLSAREKISLPSGSIDEFYKGLGKIKGIEEYLLLNTCNRTEIYAASKSNLSRNLIIQYLSKFRNLDPAFLSRYSYQRSNHEVVSHLFEVASGIDSQMVGETEILGQVKKAYSDACKRNISGKMLNRLFQKGFQAAKWARTHTGISRGQVNLGNVLCELARRIFGKVASCRLLVLGAARLQRIQWKLLNLEVHKQLQLQEELSSGVLSVEINQANWLKNSVDSHFLLTNTKTLFICLM